MRGVFQITVCETLGGGVVPYATVEFFKQSDGLAATIFATQSGGSPISNPTTADANGFVRVFLDPAIYRIVAKTSGGAFVAEHTHVAVDNPVFFEMPASTILGNGAAGAGAAAPITIGDNLEIVSGAIKTKDSPVFKNSVTVEGAGVFALLKSTLGHAASNFGFLWRDSASVDVLSVTKSTINSFVSITSAFLIKITPNVFFDGRVGIGGNPDATRRLMVNGESVFYDDIELNGDQQISGKLYGAIATSSSLDVNAGPGLAMLRARDAGTTTTDFSLRSSAGASRGGMRGTNSSFEIYSPAGGFSLNAEAGSTEINLKEAGAQKLKIYSTGGGAGFGVLNSSNNPLLTNDGNTQTIHKPTVVLGNITSSGGQFNGSGAGLTFSTGTFTPFNAGTTTAGSGTYTNQTGKHTKIGNLCFCRARLTWSAHSGAAGAWRIGGLPFTAVGDQSFALGYVNSVVFGTGKRPVALIGNGQNYIDIYLQDNTTSTVSQLSVPPAGDIVIEFFYEV